MSIHHCFLSSHNIDICSRKVSIIHAYGHCTPMAGKSFGIESFYMEFHSLFYYTDLKDYSRQFLNIV